MIRLADISAEFIRESSEIATVYSLMAAHPPVAGFSMTYGAGEDGCVVSLWDSWNRYLRALYLASAAGPVVGGGGKTHSPKTTRDERAALAHLKSGCKGTRIRFTRSEPNWNSIAASQDFCRVLELGNSQEITAALATSSITLAPSVVTQNPLGLVRLSRNFIAHKNSETYKDVAGLAPGADMRAFLARRVLGGVSQFEDWVQAMQTIAEAAAG